MFFVSGSLLSKYGPKRKRGLEQVFEKGSTRDAGQVWANGGIAGLIVIAHAISRDPLLFTAYMGALAAAAADTWGTEIGVLSRGRTWLLSTFRTVARGTSGGISVVGTLGAVLGAFVVGASGIAWAGAPMLTIAIVIISGMAGMIADGIIGATLQARYHCSSCGTATEQSTHCGVPSTLVGGYRPITNDVVNTACTLTGAATAYVLARTVG